MSSDIFFFANNQAQANDVLDELKAKLGEDHISIVLNETSQSNEIARDPSDPIYENKSGLGTTLGSLAGLGAGAALGWAILGPFMAIGPLVAAIGSATVGGTTGGLLGALVGAGFSEHHADDYHQRILAGSILIAAHPKDHTQSNVVYAVLAAHELKPLSAKEAHVVT